MSAAEDDGVLLYRTREGALRAIKAELQPLYATRAITKEEFVMAAKACLDHVLAAPAGTDAWTQPGIARHVSAFMKAHVLQHPVALRNETASDAAAAGRTPRSARPLANPQGARSR